MGDIKMSLEQSYHNLHKTAGVKPLLLASGVGAALGSLYGIGDKKHNYYSELLNPSVSSRALQGAGTLASGVAGYKALRNLGINPLLSGLGSLASGLTANRALAPSRLIKNDPTILYRS